MSEEEKKKKEPMKPYKLTPAIEEAITKPLAAGCTRTAAFSAAGIGRRTFYDWMKGVPEFKQAVEDAEANARRAGKLKAALADAKAFIAKTHKTIAGPDAENNPRFGVIKEEDSHFMDETRREAAQHIVRLTRQ